MNLCRLHVTVCSVQTGNLWGKSRLPFACKVCIIMFVPGGRKSRLIQRILTYALPSPVVLDFLQVYLALSRAFCAKKVG